MRVAGHGLMNEGAAFDDNGDRIWYSVPAENSGRGKCECGTMSDVLPSGGARRRWHADHKAAIAEGMDAATNDLNEVLNLLGPPLGWKP